MSARKKYRDYTIDYGPRGLTVHAPNGTWWSEVAVNYRTACRWIDSDIHRVMWKDYQPSWTLRGQPVQ